MPVSNLNLASLSFIVALIPAKGIKDLVPTSYNTREQVYNSFSRFH